MPAPAAVNSLLPAVDAEMEVLLRAMLPGSREHAEALRGSFARIEKAALEGIAGIPGATANPMAGMRSVGPNVMATMSDATRNAILRLSMPLYRDPRRRDEAAELGDEAEAAAMKQKVGSDAAIELHRLAMAHRSMAFGIRSELVARSEVGIISASDECLQTLFPS